MDQNQEQIDELSKSTLGSYVKKAASSAASNGKGEGSSGESHLKKQYAGFKNQRLSGISKATDRLTKEEVEPLEELSAGKLQDYKKAATERPLAKDGDKTAGGILKAARKRVAGVKTASRKLGEEAEVEQVEEGLIDAVKGVFGHSAAQKASKAHAERKRARDAEKAEAARKASRPTNDVWGNHADTTVKKGAKVHEEAEGLDELNRDTLNSYQKKADKELDQRLPKVIKAHNSSEPLSDADKKNAHKAHSRTIGSMRAHERLNKEEVEIEEGKVHIPTMDELKGMIPKAPSEGEHLKLATKGQVKMLATKARNKYATHTGVEVPGTQVKEEAIVRKGDAVTPTHADLVPPAVPTKKNPKPFGNGAASPTAPEPMKGVTCKEEVLDEISDKTLGSYKKAAAGERDHHKERLAKWKKVDANSTPRHPEDVNHAGEEHVAKKIAHHAKKADKRQDGIDSADTRHYKEEFEQIDELSNETLGRYKKAAGADASAKDKAGNFKGADKRFSGIVKATKKQFSNDTKKESVLVSFKDFIKEQQLAAVPYIAEEAEVIEEGMRLLGTHGVHGAGSKSAKVYKDSEHGEHVVKFFTNGEHHKNADYHTDDKEDAHGTAKLHTTSKNN